MRSLTPARQRRLSTAVVAVLALASTPAASSATSVARPGAETAVREYGGTIVFSAYDPTADRWYLSVRRAGATQAQRLAVAPSALTFDADIGTDSSGRPELIYQRCTATRSAPTSPISPGIVTPTNCDLFVYSLAAATGERPVRNANDPSHNDVDATLWRGRVAWTREYGSGKDANPVVYTKTLTAPRSQPSKRLPGVPQTRCGDVDKVCGPTTQRNVEALELTGNSLAVTVDYTCRGCSGIAQGELRLDDVASGSSRPVAFLVIGLNGQHFVGASFFDGRLGWYRACTSTEASCRTFAGPWRYRPSTRAYERGAPGPILVSGFADTGSLLYEVAGCYPAGVNEPELVAGCSIDAVTPPAYSKVPAPLR